MPRVLRLRVLLFAALTLSSGTWPAYGQVQRGAIAGIARDPSGSVLPGVSVTLTSQHSAPQEVVSGERGEFRFIQLDPGLYDLRATLHGFAPYLREALVVGVGGTVEIVCQLQLATVEQEVRVTAGTPLLDSRRQGHVTNFDEAMLHDVPTARDPWALMQHIPGVAINRPNVGGSQSATQAVFVARGDDGTNANWNIDGVTITDPVANGASTTYFDFNTFDEVQFTTGGLDPRQQTGALSLNIVTKRGTNNWHGLARAYFTNDSLQNENLPASLATSGLTGNRARQIAEYGGDLGGALRPSRVWVWGAIARNDIRQRAFTGVSEETVVNSLTGKVDAQLAATNRTSFYLSRAEKLVAGRFAGVTRPPETTLDQGGPTWIVKLEDTHVIGSSLFVAGKVGYVHTNFHLTPQSGLSGQAYLDQATQIWHGSQMFTDNHREVWQTHVDATYVRGRHDVVVGASYRAGSALERFGWPGNHVLALVNVPGFAPGIGLARLTRPQALAADLESVAIYVGDTFALDRWTFSGSVRFDRQSASNEPSRGEANGLAPDILPALEYTGGSQLVWRTWSPRVGASFRVTPRTIARASYARFGSQLPWFPTVAVVSPARQAVIEYQFADVNGDNLAQRSELRAPTGFVMNVNTANPAAGFSPNQYDPELASPIVHSLVSGVEHELRPDLAIGISAGYQRAVNLLWQPLIGLTTSDFVEYRTVGPVADVISTTPVFRLATGRALPPGNGVVVSNRDAYHRRYWNIDVALTKRLASRWMFRAGATIQRSQEFFDDPSRSIQDPTPRVVPAPLNGALISGFIDRGIAVPSVDGYINADWTYSVAGIYQAPWDITLSSAAYGRQGYPLIETALIQRPDGLGQTQVVLDRNLGRSRFDHLHLVDVRAERSISWAKLQATLMLDAFNVFNRNTVLRRITEVGTTFRNPTELVPPRLLRLGLQIRF